MLLTNDNLLNLLEQNPETKFIRGNNLLYIDTGGEKSIVSVRNNVMDNVLKYIKYKPIKDVKPSVLESYKFDSGKANSNLLRTINRPVGKPSINPEQRLNYLEKRGQLRRETVLPYPEISKTGINTLVNDFFVSYYDSESQLYGKKLKTAFDIYAKNKQVALDSRDISVNTGLYKQVEKVEKTLRANPKLLKDIELGFKRTLHNKVKLVDKGPGTFETAQQIIDIDTRKVSKQIMFTSKIISDKEAVRIGATMAKYFPEEHRAMNIVTPAGIRNIIAKKDYISVDGMALQPERFFTKEERSWDTLKNFNELNVDRGYAPVEDYEKFYLKKQKSIEADAISETIRQAQAVVVNKTPYEASKVLNELTIKDLKKLAHVNKNKAAANFLNYNLRDDEPLSDILRSTGDYETVISGAYSRKRNQLDEVSRSNYEKVVAKGKKLGIDEGDIVNDLLALDTTKSLIPRKFKKDKPQGFNALDGSYQKKTTDRIYKTKLNQANMLHEMSNFFTNSIDGFEGSFVGSDSRKENSLKIEDITARYKRYYAAVDKRTGGFNHTKDTLKAKLRIRENEETSRALDPTRIKGALNSTLKESQWGQKIKSFYGKDYGPPDTSDIVGALKGGKAGESFFRTNKLLLPTAANPWLNLEGKIQSKYASELLHEIFQDAMSGNEQPYNRDLLVQIGGLMSRKDLAGIAPTFKALARHQLPSSKKIAMYNKELIGSDKYNFEPSDEAKAYLDKKLALPDAMDTLVQKFAPGRSSFDEIELMFKEIKAGKPIDPKKEYQSASEVFGTSGFAADEDFSIDQVERQITELKLKRDGQIRELADNPKATFDKQLYNMSDDQLIEMIPQAKEGHSTLTGRTSTIELGKKLETFKGRLDNKAFSYYNYKDILELSNEFGYKGLDERKAKRKGLPAGNELDIPDMYGFLKQEYEKRFSTMYPGLKSINGNVRVNLTKRLFSDLARQSKQSMLRVGDNELNYMKFRKDIKYKWSTKPSKPTPKLSPAQRYMSDNQADWSHLIEAFHGDKIGKTQLIFGPKDKSREFKNDILTKLALAPDSAIDKSKLKQLKLLYDSNSIYTNRDITLNDSLNKAMREKEGKFLSPKYDVNYQLDKVLAPYNLPSMTAKYGDAFWGRKDNVPIKTFEDFYDMARFKWKRDAELTKAQKNEALISLKNTNQLKEFQAKGKPEAMTPENMMFLTGAVEAYSHDFINRQIGRRATDPVLLASIQKKTTAKIFEYGKLAQDAYNNSDYQTANSFMAGLKDLKTKFSGEETKVSVELAYDMMTQTDDAINSLVMGESSSALGKKAVAHARLAGIDLLAGGEPVSELQLKRNLNEAEELKAKLLSYKDLKYTSTKKVDIAEYLSKQNKNEDPQEVAYKKTQEYFKDLGEYEIPRNRRVKKIWGGSLEFTDSKGKKIEEYYPGKLKLDGSTAYSELEGLQYLFSTKGKANAVEPKAVGSLATFNNLASKEYSNEELAVLANSAQAQEAKKARKSKPPTHTSDKKITSSEGLPPLSGKEILDLWKNKPKKTFWGTENTFKPKNVNELFSFLIDGKKIKTAGKSFQPLSAFFRNFKGFNKGGKIPGKGVKDEVPALLTKGETVVDRETSEKLGIHTQADYERFKNAVNDNQINKFATGGSVGDMNYMGGAYSGITNVNNYFMDPKRYQVDPSITNYEQQSLANNQAARNITIDLAANKVAINMGRTDTAIINNINAAKDMGMGAETVKNARANFKTQKLTEMFGFTPEQVAELQSVTRPIAPVDPSKISTELLQKIQSTGPTKLTEGFGTLKELGLKDLGGIEKAVGKVLNPKIGKGFRRALKEMDADAELLGKMFNKDSNLFRGLHKLSKLDVHDRLQDVFSNMNFEQLSVSTRVSKTKLRAMRMALTSTDTVLKDELFDTSLRKERAGVQGIRDVVSQSEREKVRAETRLTNFETSVVQGFSYSLPYAVIGGIQKGFSTTAAFAANFSDSMKNLQAITGDTAQGLDMMSKAVKQVSTETKFSALEISEAATILGQAGFSAVDISKSLDGVVQLATATGSKLEDATQILTSTLTIWDKSLTESKDVANVFTAAINQSKLDITSLTQAVQYTGNIAASAGISSTDVVAMTGLLKDAGIKRGSTLGTGQRLLYNDLAAPSKKFIKSLKSSGIKLDDFNKAFDTEGIYGALKLMKDSGYGLAAASRGMEVREKAIYVAATNQLGKLKNFREEITGTNAAYIANKTQMEGMGNSFKNMLNSWQINLNETLTGTTGNMAKLFKQLTIDIKKQSPRENIGVEGYTLEKKFTPKVESSNIIAGAGAISALGHIGTFASTILDARKAALKDGDLKVLLGAKPTLTNSLKGLVAGGPGLSGLSKVTGAVGIGSTLAHTYMAPEGSKGAAFASGIAMTTASLLAGPLINKANVLSKGAVPATGLGGFAAKAGVAGTLIAIDQAIVSPLREKGNPLGMLATGAEGALAGGYIGGVPGMVIGGAAGLAIGALAEKDAPTVSFSKALSVLTNDAKGLSSELLAITKTANAFSDPSNFALRTPVYDEYDEDPKKAALEKKDRDIEVESKFRKVVVASQELNEKIEGLEASLDYNFNLGSVFAATPSTAADATEEQRNRARQNGTPLPSVVDKRYEIAIYSNEGTEITTDIVLYEGEAADAMAVSANSAYTAGAGAKNAPGGVNDRMFKQLTDETGKTRPFLELREQLEDATSTEDRLAINSKLIGNVVKDIIREAPEMVVGKQPELEKAINQSFDVVVQSIDDMRAPSEWRAGEMARVRERQESAIKGLRNQFTSLGNKVKSSQQAVALGVAEIRTLMKDKGYSAKEAYNEYIDSPRFRLAQSTFVKSTMKDSGINKMLDDMALGKNKLREMNVEGINLIRKLDTKASTSLTDMAMTLGPELTMGMLDISKELIATRKNISDSFKESISSFGNLSGISTAEFMKKSPDKGFVSEKDWENTVKGVEGFETDDLTPAIKGLIDVTKYNQKALEANSKALLKSYKQTEELTNNFVKGVVGLDSLAEAEATDDVKKYQLFKSLNIKLQNAGIKDMSTFRGLSEMAGTPSLSRENLVSLGVENLRSFFSEEKLLSMDNQKQASLDKLELNTIQAKEVLAKKFEFQQESIRDQGAKQKENLAINHAFNLESLAIKFNRQIEDIFIQSARAREDAYRQHEQQVAKIQLNYQFNVEKIRRQEGYNLEDLGVKIARGFRDLDVKKARGYEDLALNETRAYEDFATQKVRSREDLALMSARANEDFAKKKVRAYEDLALTKLRELAKLEIIRQRSIEDLNLKYSRNLEDIGTAKNRNVESLEINKSRSIEKALLHFGDTIAKLNRSFEHNLEALDRAKQDTIDSFERSLDRPQVVTINPEALMTVADNLGDVNLALDAHKAELTANTTAVQQNNKLQQTQEDVAKAAYKDAYKKVGGQVYNEDGSINESFTEAYDDYMAKHSEALIDAVLENAINAAYAGVGFDITAALQSPEYLAGQVAAPTPGMTMPGALAGSGLTIDELITALYDVKSDEVRVTTTAGIILEAKGGMEGAYYDLATALIGIDIKIREAGISFGIAVEEAEISLAIALRDIEISFQQGLEDIERTFKQSIDDLNLALARGMEDITIATARNMEDLNRSLKEAAEDLAISLARGAEDLAIELARAGEDLEISLARGAVDLALELARAGEDLEISIARAGEDLIQSNKDAMADVATSTKRALEEAGIALNNQLQLAGIDLANALEQIAINQGRALEDAARNYRQALEDLERNYEHQLEMVDKGIEDSLEKASDGFAQSLELLELNYEQQIEKLNEQFNDALVALVEASAAWAENVIESIAEGLNADLWGAEKIVAKLQEQLNEVLNTFKVKWDPLLEELSSSFKTLLKSEKLKNLGKLYGDALTEAIKDGLTKYKKEVKKTMAEVETLLNDQFKDKIATPFNKNNGEYIKLVQKVVTESKKLEAPVKKIGEDFKASATALEAVKKSVSMTAEDFKKFQKDFPIIAKDISTASGNINTNLKTIPTDITSVSTEIKTSVASLGTALENIGTTLKQASDNAKGKLNGIGGDISQAIENIGTKIKQASDNTKGKLNGIGGDIAGALQAIGDKISSASSRAKTDIKTSGSKVGSAIETLADNIAAAAQRAINTINAAVAAAKGAGKSTGGFIPGYGGGDIMPFMLEPGEFIVRKEIVRQLGVDRLEQINNGTGGALGIETTQSTGLPMSLGNSINVSMNVQAGTGIEMLEDNMERIADGVRKVFEEYS